MRYSENDFIKKKQNAFFLHFFYYGNANVLDLMYIKTS